LSDDSGEKFDKSSTRTRWDYVPYGSEDDSLGDIIHDLD
jgi:hypothetical protein